jgi:uncharacterized membrane protein
MQNIVAMIGISLGAGGARWYDWMFLGFGLVICFPAEFLNEISEWTGREVRLRHVVWLEVILIGLIVVLTMLLKRAYPELPWFEPLIPIGFVVFFTRGIIWFINQLSDPDED